MAEDIQTDVELSSLEVSVNLDDVETYFKFLDPNPDAIHCYAWFPQSGKGVIQGYGIRHGKVSQILQEVRLRDSVEELLGATLHAVLNQTKVGSGRKRSDVESCRVFCLDIDTELTRERTISIIKESRPQLVIQSSPGKYHLYWAASPGVALDIWSLVQSGLAAKYEGDGELTRLEHLMRVPGIERVCKDGTAWTPIIERLTDRIELGLNEILEQFGPDIIEIGQELGKKQLKERKKMSRSVGACVREVSHGEALDSSYIEALAAGIKPGNRNESLYDLTNEYVFKRGLNGVGPLTTLDEAIEFALMLDLACVRGLQEEFGEEGRREVEEAAKSAWERAAAGLEEFKRKKEERVRAIEEDGEVAGSSILATDKYTETAVAERVLTRFGGDFLRIEDDPEGKILCFNQEKGKKTWVLQTSKLCIETRQRIKAITDDLINEKEFIGLFCINSKGEYCPRTAHRAKAIFYRDSYIRSVCNLIFNNAQVAEINSSAFDALESSVYTASGVLNMSTRAVRAAIPEDLCIHRTKAKWNGKGEGSIGEISKPWVKFVEEVFDWNKSPSQMVNFMQELFGYSISGAMTEQKIFCHWGNTNNGKSKMLKALSLLGGNYATELSASTLIVNKKINEESFQRVGLRVEGKRIAIIDDMDIEGTWNTKFVKALTNTTIQVRALYQEERVVTNRCKFHMGSNKPPEPESEDAALLRRLCIIPYGRTFEFSSEAGDRIDAMILQELPGILAWAVEGWKRVVTRKDAKGINNRTLKYPAETLLAVEAYKVKYFKVETIINDIMESAQEELEPGKSAAIWVSLAQILRQVNLNLKEEGNVTSKELSYALSNKLGFKSRRLWDKAAGNVTQYLVRWKKPLLEDRTLSLL